MSIPIASAARHPRLALSWPPGWERYDVGPGQTELVLDARVLIQIRWQVPIPADYGHWIEATMNESLPNPVLTQLAFEHGESDKGWPLVFAHYRLATASGDLLEERVGTFYRILHVGAEIVVRLFAGARWDDYAATLRPIPMAGDVEWPSFESDLVYTLLGMHI